MSLNDRLKSRRKELGLTQKMLADMVGVSHVSISQWESGATSPSGINLVELVHALKTTTDWVVSGETVFRPLSISSEPDQKLQHALAKVADEMATIPTEIFNIASKFGILMTYDQLPDHESGNIKKQDEYYLITLNSRHSEAFKRFTSACLIGHVILHKESINKGLSVNLLFSTGLGAVKDSHANKAAIEILMPLNIVQQRVNAEPGITLPQLAYEFEVPVSVVSIRLGVPYE